MNENIIYAIGVLMGFGAGYCLKWYFEIKDRMKQKKIEMGGN